MRRSWVQPFLDVARRFFGGSSEGNLQSSVDKPTTSGEKKVLSLKVLFLEKTPRTNSPTPPLWITAYERT